MIMIAYNDMKKVIFLSRTVEIFNVRANDNIAISMTYH